MSDKQKTLGKEVSLSGIGLHTGRQVKLTIKPAKENTGFVFVRTDLEGHPQVEADVNYVTTTERGTTLELSLIHIYTRFHHSLGAMHLMYTALETLKQKGVKISDEEEKSAMLAILLHDVGHGPFSHALESLLMEDWHHEKLSILLMKKLNEEFNGELNLALEMFQGKYSRKFFHQLISSQ